MFLQKLKKAEAGLFYLFVLLFLIISITPGSAGAAPNARTTSQIPGINTESTGTLQENLNNPSNSAQSLNSDFVYNDSLASGWTNWSWSTTTNFANNNPVQDGNQSISVRFDQPWAGFYLHTDQPIFLESTDSISFWVHGGNSGGQTFAVALADQSGSFPGTFVNVTADAGSWKKVELSATDLGSITSISGIVWQEFTGLGQATLYLDEITINSAGAPPPPPPGPGNGPTLQVDTSVTLGNIPDEIYGMNFADQEMAAELRLPLNRWGGNATTRYNWQVDTSNRGSDWFFENIPNTVANPNQLPNGSHADQFVMQNQATGTESLLTIPTIGWTPKDREYRCGFSVSLYGNQQSVDPWRTDCGNGLKRNGREITNNNPLDTSIAVDPSFSSAWINHLMSNFGGANNGGVQYYALDNEPFLWHHTHRDVHPDPVGYDELLDRSLQYGLAIKETDPNAMVLGPTVWGWTAYFYSAIDSESGNWSNPPDQNAHGGMPLVPWYLQQMRQFEISNDVRILDYLDLHYYPQTSGIALSPAGNDATQDLRLRSTRSLWDPTYVDESWIGEPVQLISRMRTWVNQYYPDTKLAITEYNWGALDHINGALAQADVLGIFGREGLDLATLWQAPALDEPGSFAFRMYRNYDGQGGEFGDQRLTAISSDQDALSIYAARRSSDGALTFMIINKSDGSLESSLQLFGQSSGTAEIFQYSEANLQAIQQLPDSTITNGALTMTYPANSITLLVID